MTREILHSSERSTLKSHDDATYSALWATAPFARLPESAPPEIRSLVIDVHNPYRVYTIHRAVRRHQFHSLVESFIVQIRYGCDSPKCHTPSCFSYRKRLSSGAPVRRYNATSARALAVYLASQENAEYSICPFPKSRQSVQRRSKSVKSASIFREDLEPSSYHDTRTRGQAESKKPDEAFQAVEKSVKDSQDRQAFTIANAENGGANSIAVENDANSEVSESPVRADHKSFVQALFGTAAFKVVEWLAPRNVQKAIGNHNNSSQRHTTKSTNECAQDASAGLQTHTSSESAIRSPSPATGEEPCPASPSASTADHTNGDSSSPRSRTSAEDTETSPLGHPDCEKRQILRRKNSHVRTLTEPLEIPQKAIVNRTIKEIDSDEYYLPQFKTKKDSNTIRQAYITTPRVTIPQAVTRSPKESPKIEKGTMTLDTTAEVDIETPDEQHTANKSETVRLNNTTTDSHDSRGVRPCPQSLSSMPPEVILSLTQRMATYNICEDHNLFPRCLSDEVQPQSSSINSKLLQPRHDLLGVTKLEQDHWRLFAEQTIFDVLSKPDTLLQSFRHDHVLLDNMTLWYLMLHLTRCAPSLVFDSLWHASEALYDFPRSVLSTHDPKRTASSSKNPIRSQRKSLSSVDVVHVFSVCLQALIASAPLIHDSRQITSMSRTRSNGSSMLGRDASSPESVLLGLWYNDAFTDGHALRLARRVFAAIPSRYSIDDLLQHHASGKDNSVIRADLLDMVLDTLTSHDTQSTLINFTSEDIITHETRAIVLLLDWARTIMTQDWTGAAEIHKHSSFGGALTMLAAIHRHRKSLLLGDLLFQTSYFAERLDLITTASEWSRFEQNRRTAHLLDFPFLFHPETLVSYFRAINYSRMNEAYEKAKSSSGMMNTAVSQHSLMIDRNRRQRLAEQMRTANSPFLVLEVRRSHILLDAFNSLWRREEREILRPIKLRLGEDSGEEGMDLGGVQQEFFNLAVAEALDADFGAFTVDTRTRMTWFQPGSPEPLWKFELIGIIISLAVYNGLTLPITFPKALYRRLLGKKVTELHHIQDGWPDLAAGLTSLIEWNEADGTVEDVFSRTYEFSVSQYGRIISRDMSTDDQWPQFSEIATTVNPVDAPSVTNANRNQYVSDYIHWLTDVSVRPQFEAFKRGFFSCLTQRSVTLFDAATLQSLIEGEQTIDISELRRVARYQGWDSSHRTVRDFWSVVKRFDADKKRKLLEFVTASDRVPVGGMRNMQFTLQKNGQDDIHLPTSATCFGILLLPEYSSKEILKQKLLAAVENSRGFGAM